MASSSTSDENEFDAYCGFTPSQEELLFGNPQVSSPESSVSHPSPTPTPSYFNRNAVHICTALDTAPSGIASISSSDQFETPPEENRRSISEEALSLDGGESDDSATGKRVRPWRVPARFKRVRASGESSAKVNTPSVAAKFDSSAETGGTVNLGVDTEVLGSRVEAGKKVVDTVNSVNIDEKLASWSEKETKRSEKGDGSGATGDNFENA